MGRRLEARRRLMDRPGKGIGGENKKIKRGGEKPNDKVMNGRLPGLAKLLAIFTTKVIGIFFNFEGFPNET
jgi:hypothetical protein